MLTKKSQNNVTFDEFNRSITFDSSQPPSEISNTQGLDPKYSIFFDTSNKTRTLSKHRGGIKNKTIGKKFITNGGRRKKRRQTKRYNLLHL